MWTTAAAIRKSTSVRRDRKSTRLNSSHLGISYAAFCLKKKKVRIAATGKQGKNLGHLSKKAVSYSSPSRMKGDEGRTMKIIPKVSADPPIKNDCANPAS